MTLRSGEVLFSEPESSVTIPESISIFGFSISFYGLFLVLAALTGIFIVVRETKKKQQNLEWNITLITITILSALLGARLYYVLFHWRVFIQDPLVLLNFRSGGVSYFGALFGAWFAVKGYCRRKKEDFFQGADTLSIGAAAAAPLVWLGCAMVREPVGRFSDGIFSVRISEAYLSEGLEALYAEELLENSRMIGDDRYVSVHPVAIYGVVCSAVVFFLIWFLKRFFKQPGGAFSLYLLLNAILCFGLELVRGDRCYIWGTNIPVNCVVSVVLIVTITAGWMQQYFQGKKPWEKHL